MEAGHGGGVIQRILKDQAPALFGGKHGVRRTLHRVLKKQTPRSIVLNLADLAHVSDPCSAAALKQAALSSFINRDDISGELAAMAESPDPIPISLLHVNRAHTEAYVIPAGAINPLDTRSLFSVDELSRSAHDDDSSPAMSRASTLGAVPLPAYVPGAKDELQGPNMHTARLEQLMLSLGYILSETCTEVPSGGDWWGWAHEDIGSVDDYETHFVLKFVIVLLCRDQKGLSRFIGKYRGLLDRCCRADQTFLRRMQEAFPAYKTAHTAKALGNVAERHIRAMAEAYKTKFYTKKGAMAFGLPYFMKGGVYGFLQLYDE